MKTAACMEQHRTVRRMCKPSDIAGKLMHGGCRLLARAHVRGACDQMLVCDAGVQGLPDVSHNSQPARCTVNLSAFAVKALPLWAAHRSFPGSCHVPADSWQWHTAWGT